MNAAMTLNPWWQLDLFNNYKVFDMTNRKNMNYYSRLNGAEIRIIDFLDDNNDNNNPSSQCNRMEGRYISVVIPGRSEHLTLCEVAKFKGAEYFRKALYIVTSVTITNRGDCCHTNINGAEIRIGKSLQDNGIHNTLAGVITSIPAGRSLTLSWNKGIEGRYVAVVLPKTSTLVLCEVEVYGYLAPTGKNVALRGKATQSSLHGFGFAYNAIDGNRDNAMEHGSCTHTSGDLNPWWRLDLLNTYKVFSITITNRKNLSYSSRLNGAEIRIGDSLDDNNGNNNPRCAVISSIPAGLSSTFKCNGMEGRYVNVVIPGRKEYLTLCEVEVYGSPLD
ncbi:uncharacterized protein [Oncorhynchus clarkii lewisi]|uniref:uncharacterized protein n=1 Tax=Oncorhynchus clarkii lewisi TaxID=490388 RepID=UPI0039B9B5D6